MFEVKPVTGFDLAFGPTNVRDFMPLLSETKDYPRKAECEEMAQRVFFEGADSSSWVAREGVDKGAALAHFAAVLRSFEPKHEHKIAACGYMLSQWFESF